MAKVIVPVYLNGKFGFSRKRFFNQVPHVGRFKRLNFQQGNVCYRRTVFFAYAYLFVQLLFKAVYLFLYGIAGRKQYVVFIQRFGEQG